MPSVPTTHYEDNRAPLSHRVTLATLGRFTLYAANETAGRLAPYPPQTRFYFLPTLQDAAFVHTAVAQVQSVVYRPGLQLNTANAETLRSNQV